MNFFKILIFFLLLDSSFTKSISHRFVPKNEAFKMFQLAPIFSQVDVEDWENHFINAFEKYVRKNSDNFCVKFKDKLGSNSICLKELFRELSESKILTMKSNYNICRFIIKELSKDQGKYSFLGPQFTVFKNKNIKLSLLLMQINFLIREVNLLEKKVNENAHLSKVKVEIAGGISLLLELFKESNQLFSELKDHVETQNLMVGDQKEYRKEELDTFSSNKFLFEKFKKIGLNEHILVEKLDKYSKSTNELNSLR